MKYIALLMWLIASVTLAADFDKTLRLAEEGDAITDPILEFIKLVRGGEEIYSEIYSKISEDCIIIKIEGDFDQDDDTDYLLSSRCPYGNNAGWGNAGGPWQMYFNMDGTYQNTQELFFHPLGVRIYSSNRSGEFFIEHYIRLSADEGSRVVELVGLNSKQSISDEEYNQFKIHKLNKVFTELPRPKWCVMKDIEIGQCDWKEGYYSLDHFL